MDGPVFSPLFGIRLCRHPLRDMPDPCLPRPCECGYACPIGYSVNHDQDAITAFGRPDAFHPLGVSKACFFPELIVAHKADITRQTLACVLVV